MIGSGAVAVHADFELHDDLLAIGGGLVNSYGREPLIGVKGKLFNESGLSWRVHLLPFMDESVLYEQFRLDEPWDSEHNLALLERMPDAFRGTIRRAGYSTVHLPICEGSLFTYENAKLNVVRDGTLNTLSVVVGTPETATEWTRPGFLDIDTSSPTKKAVDSGLATVMGGHPVVLSAGAPKLLNRSLDSRQFSLLLDPDDGSCLVPGYHLRPWPSIFFTAPDFSWDSIFRGNRGRPRPIHSDPAWALRIIVDALKKLPAQPEGPESGLSWRVRILPYIGHKSLYDQFRLNEPWDSPTNKSLMASIPPLYRYHGAGFHVVRNLDNSESGVAVVMTRHGGNWTAPDRLLISSQTENHSFALVDGGFPVAMKDGNVHLLSPEIPNSLLIDFLTGKKPLEAVSDYLIDWADASDSR